MTQTTIEHVKQIDDVAKKTPAKAVDAYKTVLSAKDNTDIAAKELALVKLGELLASQKDVNGLAELVQTSRPVLLEIAKAKAARVVKSLIDHFSNIPGALDTQVKVCKEFIDWAVAEKRIYLKQSLETRLAALYLDNKMYADSLSLVGALNKELKRLDDKSVLMEVQLLESRVHHATRNLPKARAALTSARTSANSIYCPPLMQAQLDQQSGILHAEEKDYKTAYSYFYEALEGFSTQDDSRAVLSLKYLLLCKIMLNLADDVFSIINSKMALKYAGVDIEAMKAVATAHQNRSLLEFEQSMNKFKNELRNDPIINAHLDELYDSLLQQNLLRVIEPFSRVEIAHVAHLVKLPTQQVEVKLSQMILDGVFHGILDQGAGCLIVFEDPEHDKTYAAALDTLKNMGNVVESLYEKAAILS
ncbi:PCI-domain-containing protein [Rhizoclosmatium globosum]|uniref:PCI-domain-containing protein n=1 Tax=Rhizoclosmatium globosum TaxID=329046 RepID=A0A1Y2CCM7_9FUNG|nr:PCI-domain-containing protein [Rhizoclosmatium globosum]|eukprot:ORY44783.1 PCI-domain-containing protein [Rhizoclosmatium globosum]